jgi:hypothetical protein
MGEVVEPCGELYAPRLPFEHCVFPRLDPEPPLRCAAGENLLPRHESRDLIPLDVDALDGVADAARVDEECGIVVEQPARAGAPEEHGWHARTEDPGPHFPRRTAACDSEDEEEKAEDRRDDDEGQSLPAVDIDAGDAVLNAERLRPVREHSEPVQP